MRAYECGSELVVLARRRALTSSEAMALRAHLVECPSCRIAQQVAEDFQQEPAPAEGDDAAVLRMAELARRWTRERDRPRVASGDIPRRPMRIMAFAASLVLIAGLASAVWRWRRPQGTDPLPQNPTTPTSLVPTSQGDTPTPVTPVPVPVPTPMSSAPESPPASQSNGERLAPPLTAAQLLQRANEARRRGDIPQAIALYRRLQQVFPKSSEAVLSAAPLGGLLLERGGPRPALEQFDRYLREAPRGVLVPEALYGRGRALRALGDPTEERRTWSRLIQAFPESPYAPLARRRLADLQ